MTDGAGQYKITALRPGVYSVTFTLPGFSVVKRENVELTSDFTATINADMKIGAVEETITVAAESPIVDVQNVTTRTVMTRDVLDAIPTGRNIQAVGIMIPGTNVSFGGGSALNRDVGGSGNLQQSPLNYKGSNDAVQTVEGMRLNNLCANGAYSGVYWNDGSWEQISYVTGADSAEIPRQHDSARRRQHVSRRGRRQLHDRQLAERQPAEQPCRRSHLQPVEPSHEHQRHRQNLGLQSLGRWTDRQGQSLVAGHLPSLGRQQDDR
ncbi:MAG: hypothetical protein DMG01_18235 [Acidobacteria bacterium]|nr:MAG: hypothetical protein DMG01_18235 [Acidobacteriota bacterium]